MKKLKVSEKEVRQAVKKAIEENKKTATLRCVDSIGSGRHSSYSADRTNKYVEACTKFGIKFHKDNDAPRGGQTGNIVIIKIDKRNAFIKEIAKEVEEEIKLEIKNNSKFFDKLKKINKEEARRLIHDWKESDSIRKVRIEHCKSLKLTRNLLIELNK